jgi:hypothetical protein
MLRLVLILILMNDTGTVVYLKITTTNGSIIRKDSMPKEKSLLTLLKAFGISRKEEFMAFIFT